MKYRAAIASVIYSFYSCRVCNTPVQELPEHVFEVDAESDSKTVSHLLFLLYLILLGYIIYHNNNDLQKINSMFLRHRPHHFQPPT